MFNTVGEVMRNAIVLIVSIFFTAQAGADAPSGKALFETICSGCHESDDFKGENPNFIAEKIGKVMSGEIKHKKKLSLTHEEAAAVAAFMTNGT